MTQVAGGLEALHARTRGRVIGPGDPDYDAARTVWNGEVDRRPAAVVRCAGTDDVVAALRHAAGEGMRVTVRGGAHGSPGGAVGDDRLMIDLSGMRDVVVDPVARRASVGGGALLADLDAATQEHGLAVPAGLVSHTGLGGLTLGGGMGWLSRRHGLTIDNLLAVEIVTADGVVRTASAAEHPDLFWAVRGGGPGFGVVTRFELALHPVGPMIDFGLFFFGLDRARDALRLARDLMADLPDDLNLVVASLNAPPEPFVPAAHRYAPGWALMLAGFGPPAAHAAAVARIRAHEPLFDTVSGMPYTALQQIVDEGASAWGTHCYDKAVFVDGLSDEVIEALVAGGEARAGPLTMISLYLLDGAYTHVADGSTAFAGRRTPRLNVFLVGAAPSADGLPAQRTWARGLHDALAPLACGDGAYLNGVADPDEAARRAAWGDKYAFVSAIRRRYDPDGLFDLTPGDPAGTGGPR